MTTRKKRYAQVGVGGRSTMYLTAVAETFAESCELVALCDNNHGRVELRRRWARERGLDVPGYAAEDFDLMIAQCRPDVVVVTTKDCYHDTYICRAMELGCDVITEKPMTTDAGKCRRIIDTQKRTGRSCRVTFNYRYSPPRTQVKELLMSGVIGNVVAVDFHWLLNTQHGADYFRRWHRNKANSGGLMVHKATHHFDLVNWWLSTVPARVYASGSRNFYTPETAARYGLHNRAERCLDCPEGERCPFRLDLRANAGLTEVYLDNERYDGYQRDRCVFSADIDIEDTMQLTVDYRSGAHMSYSLHAFMPWEGFVVCFNGTKGRIEHKCQESSYINGDDQIPGELLPEGTYTRVFPHFQAPYEVELWTGAGGHGGGDPALLVDLFSPAPPTDPYRRAADQRAGAYSILTGVAANRSMADGMPVRIDDLVTGVAEPDMPAMPTAAEPIDPAPLLQGIEAQRRNREAGQAAVSPPS